MAVTQTSRLLATTVLDSEHLLGVAPLDESEIDDSKSDAFSPWLPPFSEIDPLSQLHIGGDEDLQNKIRLLCHEFGESFSNELPDSPALIPPFDIVVDDTKWKVSKLFLVHSLLLIRLKYFARFLNILSKGSLKNPIQLIIVRFFLFQNLVVLNACV